MSKKGIALVALVAIVLIPCIASAASQGYSSYLILPPNVQVEGSARNYTYANHKVSISIDSIPAPNEPKMVVISLNKKTLIFSSQQSRKVTSYALGNTVTTQMGNYGSGKKFYGFGSFENALKDGNSGHGKTYAGINSDNVVMTSYN